MQASCAPEVDVLIPVFNAEKTIFSAISSIQSQTIKNIRIIVVNDGSSDGTLPILEGMAQSDDRLILVNKENSGIVDALNCGLTYCTAEFVARHDADDIAMPSRIAVQLEYLRDNQDCAAVGCNIWHINGAGHRTGSRTHFNGDAHPDPYFAPAKEPYLMHPVLMIRTNLIKGLGGYRYVFHSEDADLYWRLVGIGRLHNVPDILGEYRIHNNSISGASITNGRIQAIYSQLAVISYLRCRDGVPDIKFERTMLSELTGAQTTEDAINISSTWIEEGEKPLCRVRKND